MADWLSSMQQTFEYYIVDPETWKDKEQLNNVKSSSIERDAEAETLGSASIDITDSINECYVRIYLVTIQNGIKEKHPLATVLVQTPSTSFDGKIHEVSLDAYTPLLELKENPPDYGYTILKNTNIMDRAYMLVREHARAPVVKTNNSTNLQYDFVAETDDTWMSYLSDLIANAKYEFALDELGNIMFSPVQETAALQPVWTYDDSNSSILHPEISLDRDLYGIPNVVEVIYSQPDGTGYLYARVVNDDGSSPISTVSRGREIIHRVTNPEISGSADQTYINEYAKSLLKSLSTLEYTITYTHGYCPVRIGDCVRLNYERAGMTDIKAKVVKQTIKCEPGCPVTEKAVYTKRLWGDSV